MLGHLRVHVRLGGRGHTRLGWDGGWGQVRLRGVRGREQVGL